MAASAMLLTACNDNSEYLAPGGNTAEGPSLKSFSTTQDVQFDLSFNVAKGYISTFDVYAENPLQVTVDGRFVLNTDLSSVAAGVCESGKFNMTKNIPGYVTKLYAYSESLFAPLLMEATIVNGVAKFTEVSLMVDGPAVMAQKRSIADDKTYIYLQPLNASHRPENIDKVIDIPSQLLIAVDKAFPETKPATAPYIREASLELTKDAEIWITPLKTGCALKNSLGYFCYNGPKEDLANLDPSQIDEKEIIAFPWAQLQTGANNALAQDGLHVGDGFQLKYYDKATGQLVNTFPAGTTIVWVLHARAFDEKTQLTNAGYKEMYRFYSIPSWNKEQEDHTIYFEFTHNNRSFLCFGFEDREFFREENGQQVSNSDRDYNDLIFCMELNPEDAVTPPPAIDIDDNDYITKHEERKGVLAFEDLWPSKGDYDMNDVVLTYESDITYRCKAVATGSVSVTKIEDTFTFLHAGASLNNAFFYKVDVNPAFVVNNEVLIDGVASPIRPDGDGFIVDLCPNVNQVITPYLYGCTPKVYKVEINFTFGKVLQNTFAPLAAPYNPFIAPNEKPGVEVHLPLYAPTSGAALSYFGTNDDKSDLENKIYYVRGLSVQYPFAIHLSGVTKFKIPLEAKPIDVTYPRYTNWVESNFQADKDWYVGN